MYVQRLVIVIQNNTDDSIRRFSALVVMSLPTMSVSRIVGGGLM